MLNGVSQNPDNCSLVDKSNGYARGYFYNYDGVNRKLVFTSSKNLRDYGITGSYTINCIFTNNGITESVNS